MIHPKRTVAVILAVLAVIGAVTWWMGRPDEAGAPPTASRPAGVTVPAAVTSSTTSTGAATSVPGSVPDVAGVPYPVGPVVELPVAGGIFPTTLGRVYLESGGKLLTEVQAPRYGIGSWPTPTGGGVYTTDVEVSVELHGDGTVTREDAMVWLFPDDRPLAGIVTDLAVLLGLPGAVSTETRASSTGPCSLSVFELAGVTWELGGCEFEQFPGVRSLAVSRTARYDTSGRPETGLVMPPDVSGVLSAVKGEVTGWSVAFGSPDVSTGSTVRRTVTVSTGRPVTVVADELAAVLPGAWTREDGIDDVVTFASPVAVWTVNPDGTVLYTVWGDE